MNDIEVDLVIANAEIEQLRAEVAMLREANKCEYSIHTPSEEGYPDVEGRFYQCSCGADYIDIEQSEEWEFCPHCGKEIFSRETLLCTECESAEWDGDCNYCNNENGKNFGEIIDNMDFRGCTHWRSLPSTPE